MDAFEAGGQDVELALDFFGEHVRVEQGRDGAAGGVASDEQGAGAAGRVFFEEGAEASGNRFDHFAGDGEKTRMAEIAGVVLVGCVSFAIG